MSASLVGSEMCIRDSGSAWGIALTRPEDQCDQPGAGARVVEEAPCTGTVSYTHLTLPTICSV
eukprot:1194574-Alexandrium_andersonii.AAC.1